MKLFQRLTALLLSLLVMAVFYVFAVMMEDEESKRSDTFVVEAVQSPLVRQAGLESASPEQLAQAFGVAFPLPEGFEAGKTRDFTWHARPAREIILRGAAATVRGVRPAAAASAILPRDADFVSSSKALLGYQMLSAQAGGKTLYALVTKDAAFLIEPASLEEPGGFSLMEP